MPFLHDDRQRHRFAHEGEHERRGRVVVKLVGRSGLLDAALIEHDDPIRKLHRLVLVVRDEDGRQPRALMDLAQPAPQILAHARVQRAEGLVEQQHARLDRQSPRERDALPLAAGKLRRITLAQSFELHEAQ